MKAIYLFFLVLITQTASGQDFCNKVKKEESGGVYDFASPYDPAEIPALRVSRSYNKDPDYPSDNFYLTFYMTGKLESIYELSASGEQLEKQEKKLIVEFDDKTVIVDDSIKIIHDRTADMLEAVRYVILPMTANNLKDFTTKKITKFSLAGFEQAVPADSANAMMHYVQCIKAVK